jgi:aldehyde dehydrogenase (NAD+)
MPPYAFELPTVVLRSGEDRLSSGSGGVHQHVEPATGIIQAEIPLAGPNEINAAVVAAANAFASWGTCRPATRRDALLKLGDLLAANRMELAEVAARENGTPVRLGIHQIALARNWMKYYAGWADKLDGAVSSTFASGGDFTYSVAEPYGVIGAIITWNVPLISLCMKLAPALAAGNTVVVKPSELTPFTPELFARFAEQAGIPAGVINVLPGTASAGEALIAHPLVQKVTFTGGPTTARRILAVCASHLKPSVMELGGKSANLVFGDANLDTAVDDVVRGGLAAVAGQACIMGSRVLVHDSVYDEMLDRLESATQALIVGNPVDRSTTFGPVINEAACSRILNVIERATNSGEGRLLTGGHRLNGVFANGTFVAPTLFADVDPTSSLAQSEVFGPVAGISRFSDEDHAVSIANNTAYGLAAYIHSNDLGLVHRLAGRLRAGSVYVNGAIPVVPGSPFGGLGESGFGREGGRPGIEEFVRPKTVSIAQPRGSALL